VKTVSPVSVLVVALRALSPSDATSSDGSPTIGQEEA
jgi:hypothetical protein